MPAFRKLPEALSVMRQRRGLTGLQVATGAGIKPPHFSRIQSGKVLPSLPVLGRILGFLGYTVLELAQLMAQLEMGKPITGEGGQTLRQAAARLCAAGHVVSPAEAEILHQIFQALLRLGEVDAGKS